MSALKVSKASLSRPLEQKQVNSSLLLETVLQVFVEREREVERRSEKKQRVPYICVAFWDLLLCFKFCIWGINFLFLFFFLIIILFCYIFELTFINYMS